jgi:ABC-type glycerol-3-phosphate transport system substrate-binding protein
MNIQLRIYQMKKIFALMMVVSLGAIGCESKPSSGTKASTTTTKTTEVKKDDKGAEVKKEEVKKEEVKKEEAPKK